MHDTTYFEKNRCKIDSEAIMSRMKMHIILGNITFISPLILSMSTAFMQYQCRLRHEAMLKKNKNQNLVEKRSTELHATSIVWHDEQQWAHKACEKFRRVHAGPENFHFFPFLIYWSELYRNSIFNCWSESRAMSGVVSHMLHIYARCLLVQFIAYTLFFQGEKLFS